MPAVAVSEHPPAHIHALIAEHRAMVDIVALN
jgi:hypothetical protein